MFSVNPRTKKKEDAHLHGPILADGDTRHGLTIRRAARKRAAKLHKLTAEQLDRAYGKDSRHAS